MGDAVMATGPGPANQHGFSHFSLTCHARSAHLAGVHVLAEQTYPRRGSGSEIGRTPRGSMGDGLEADVSKRRLPAPGSLEIPEVWLEHNKYPVVGRCSSLFIYALRGAWFVPPRCKERWKGGFPWPMLVRAGQVRLQPQQFTRSLAAQTLRPGSWLLPQLLNSG